MPASERLLKRLHALYDTLPTIACKGWCWNSCGPIDMSKVERQRLVDLGTDVPVFTEERAKAWAENETANLYCPALSHGAVDGEAMGCTVYKDRPMVCRIWGVSESMLCPYGCEVDGKVLSNLESFEMLARADQIGGNAHGINPDDMDVFRRVLEDPEGADIISRYLEGDMTVRDRALRLIDLAATDQKRKSHGRPTA